MVERRELRLVQQGSPCDNNYFDRSLLTITQARQIGRNPCPNYTICRQPLGDCSLCSLRYGAEVAKYVMQGGDLRTELLEFSQVPHIVEEYWNSVNRRDFKLIKGKAQVIRAVEGFARIVLLEDPFQSVFPICEKCEGAKLEITVIDSARDGVSPLSGSGRTRTRNVIYCPSCESVLRGGTFEESILDDLV